VIGRSVESQIGGTCHEFWDFAVGVPVFRVTEMLLYHRIALHVCVHPYDLTLLQAVYFGALVGRQHSKTKGEHCGTDRKCPWLAIPLGSSSKLLKSSCKIADR
jgi:tetrahydromethanopterin S-methyltransferase subunit E